MPPCRTCFLWLRDAWGQAQEGRKERVSTVSMVPSAFSAATPAIRACQPRGSTGGLLACWHCCMLEVCEAALPAQPSLSRGGRQKHGLKVCARTLLGGRGNHRQRGQAYVISASALNSKHSSGRGRRIMSAMSVILSQIFVLRLAWPPSGWEVDASPSQPPCSSQKMMT